MKYSDIIWNEFIYGSHWGSLNAIAISISIILILNINCKWEFLLISYLLTQCIYSYNHCKEMEIDSISNAPRVEHLKRFRNILPLLTGLYGVLFFSILIYFGNKESIFFGGFLLILGLLFTVIGKKISKKIVGFKSFYTALAWALLIVFTTVYHSYSMDSKVIILLIFVFLRLVINTSFSDIKDLEGDRKNNIFTLPMIFKNVKNWLTFLHFLNILSFIPLLFGIITGIIPNYTLFLFFTFFYSFYYIHKAKNEDINKNSLYNVIVDGEYYYWPALLLIGSIICI